ncbi:MAG: restriction endonuclease [Clostridiales bacterium]|nr:restriction endonuclease [Clostridiales bacterium]
MSKQYVRQQVEGFILKALQALGGTASRKAIKDEIVDDDKINISYQDVYESIISKNGNYYIPFNLDFSFALVNLHTCGYINDYVRQGDISLTEKGRGADYTLFPSDEERDQMRQYWKQKDNERLEKKNTESKADNGKNDSGEHNLSDPDIDIIEDNDTSEDWKDLVLKQIKQFSPKKFESFSRLLLSNMGIKFDHEKGVQMSGDHGIDGFGYFESDEFRTAKVVIQCKRYSDNPVSEPEIDKFKGVMMSFNADYGIFITTSFFTQQAQAKAVQGGYTVTLIDGQRLVELIQKYQLHITPIITYELNDYYFQKD